jgi:hypothetical protein
MKIANYELRTDYFVKFKFLAKFLYCVMNGVFILNFTLYAV